jgi:hypothetical protein
MPEVSEVSFEWENGPNANSEFHRLDAFDVDGNKVDHRTEVIKYHKNGKWSYSEVRIFVPSGTIIRTAEQNTHGSRVSEIWIATESGRVHLAKVYGKWNTLRDWPDIPDNMSEEQWRTLLSKLLVKETVEQWVRNASIRSI